MAVEPQEGLGALNSNPIIAAALDLVPISQAGLMVGEFLLPGYEVTTANYRYRTVDLGQASRLVLDTLLALDAKAKEIRTDTALAEAGMDEYMLKTLIADQKIREADAGQLIPGGSTAYVAEQMAIIRELMIIGREYRLIALETSLATFSSDHQHTGFDFRATGILDFFLDEVVQKIRGSIGRGPNGVLFTELAWLDIRKNDEIKAAYATPAGGTVRINEALVADYLEVDEVQVIRSGWRDENKEFHRMAEGKAMVATFSDRANPRLNNMSFGVNAFRTYDGVAFDVRQSDPQGVERLVEHGACEQYRPVITNEDAGFIVTD